MHKILIVSAAALALVGCNKAQNAGGGAGASSSAAATPVAPGASSTIEMPMRKAGLWEQSMLFDGQVNASMGKIHLCVGPKTNAVMSLFGNEMKASQDCQQSISRGLDGAYAMTATCKTPEGGTTVSHGTVSGDYTSNVKIHSESDTTGAPEAGRNGHKVIDITMTYLGACPPDLIDGDETVNGMKINMVKMLGDAAASK